MIRRDLLGARLEILRLVGAFKYCVYRPLLRQFYLKE